MTPRAPTTSIPVKPDFGYRQSLRRSGLAGWLAQLDMRFLVFMLVSGVLHAGVFVVGAGVNRELLAGSHNLKRAATLSVSIVPASPAPQESGASARPSKSAPPKEIGRQLSERPLVPRTDDGTRADLPIPEPLRKTGRAPAPELGVNDKNSVHPQSVRNPEPRNRTERKDNQETTRQVVGAGESSDDSTSTESRPSDSDLGAVDRTYLGEFLAALSRNKHYPQSARLRRQQGKVVVALVLHKDGTINDVHVAEPSRFPLLNRAALRTVRQLDRFKPFPADMHRASWELTVPFQYAIRDQ